jgi:hypothetical protein
MTPVPMPAIGQLPSYLKGDGQALAARMRRYLEVGETFYVAPHMLDLARGAGESMPDEAIVIEDLPTMAGFMWLPKPLGYMDIRGRFLTTNALVWAAVGGIVEVYMLTDKDDKTDMMNVLLREDLGDAFARLPKFSMSHLAAFQFGQPLPRGVTMATLVDRPDLVSYFRDSEGNLSMFSPEAVDLHGIAKGATTNDKGESTVPVHSTGRDPTSATLLALWRLMQQPIVDLSVLDTPRPLRRQLRRAGLPDQRVTVIELRRREGVPHPEGEGVDWQHRWIVRGHWRKQPCKVEGEWSHRVIWIDPYVKGPEDKPLIMRDRVNALLR